MDGTSSRIEFAFQTADFASQPITFLAQPVPLTPQLLDVSLGVIPLASQLLDFALLPLEFGDQVLTRGRAPARSHALVMPRMVKEYKRKVTRSRRSDPGRETLTR